MVGKCKVYIEDIVFDLRKILDLYPDKRVIIVANNGGDALNSLREKFDEEDFKYEVFKNERDIEADNTYLIRLDEIELTRVY